MHVFGFSFIFYATLAGSLGSALCLFRFARDVFVMKPWSRPTARQLAQALGFLDFRVGRS